MGLGGAEMGAGGRGGMMEGGGGLTYCFSGEAGK